MSELRWAIALAGGAAIGAASWRLGWLRADGAVAAAGVGAAVLGLGGWTAAACLGAFFLTSTLLGRLRATRHPPRTAREVLANGGPAALAAGLAAAGAGAWAVAALVGALAAANADTWATEVGTRFGGAPRALGLGPRLAAGASGGMTAAGTLAGFAGGALIAAVAAGGGLPHALPAAVGGAVGMLADTLLGATVQGLWRCPSCGARLENPRGHDCAAPARRERGLTWCDNDLVNLAMTVAGGAAAALLAR